MTKQGSSPKSFESAISELEAIVHEMETGSISLEQALERYQRGVELLKYCQATLQQAEQRVRQLEGGKLVPIDAGATGEHPS